MVERNPGVAGTVANDVTVPPETIKTSVPCVTKMSRGVNPACADWDGAIAMYFSKHGPTGPGIVANNELFLEQSIVSIFWLQYSVTSRSVFEAATPTGSGTMAKGLGLAA